MLFSGVTWLGRHSFDSLLLSDWRWLYAITSGSSLVAARLVLPTYVPHKCIGPVSLLSFRLRIFSVSSFQWTNCESSGFKISWTKARKRRPAWPKRLFHLVETSEPNSPDNSDTESSSGRIRASKNNRVLQCLLATFCGRYS